MEFSRRYGFDPQRTSSPIVEDAPDWLRAEFYLTVLGPLLYTDQDSRIPNPEQRPLGVKALHQRLSIVTRTKMDEYDWDSWTCWDGLERTLAQCTWWQFYDCVEVIGEQLLRTDKQYAPGLDWDGNFDEFRFSTYQLKVNALFEKSAVAWRLNAASALETALPKDLAHRIDNVQARLADAYQPARAHYVKAKKYMLGVSKDPENSIKESVSALESVLRTMYPGAATLGKAISKMKNEGRHPPRLLSVIEKFYEYCCDEPAVRHGSDRASRTQELDAELALHLSAAFIRYVLESQTDKTSG